LSTTGHIENSFSERRNFWAGYDMPPSLPFPSGVPRPAAISVPGREARVPALLGHMSGKTTLNLARGSTIYWDGDRADSVCYNLKGTVLLKVVSSAGKEGVVGIIPPGEFFGETCVFDEPNRTSSAMALEPTTVMSFDKQEVRNTLRNSPQCAEEFMRLLIVRNERIQNHLTDQLFSSSEVRLLRILRLLARGRERAGEKTLLPKISQSILASIVGTTRSRICYFLVEFRKAGIVDSRKGLRVDTEAIDAMLRRS